MDKLEKLYVGQALFNVVGSAVSTKGEGSLRSECDREMVEAYEREGIKGRDARVNGEKVGTYSIRVKKAESARDAWVEERAVMQDVEMFDAWFTTNGPEELEAIVKFIRFEVGADTFAQWYLDNTGELPDGCELLRIDHPAQPAQPERCIGTVLKVEPEKVAQALKGELPAVVAGLLGGE